MKYSIFLFNLITILLLSRCEQSKKSISEINEGSDSIDVETKDQPIRNEKTSTDQKEFIVEEKEKFEGIEGTSWVSEAKGRNGTGVLIFLDNINFKEYSAVYLDTLFGTYSICDTKDTLFLFRKQLINSNDNPNKPDGFSRHRIIAFSKNGKIRYTWKQLGYSGDDWGRLNQVFGEPLFSQKPDTTLINI